MGQADGLLSRVEQARQRVLDAIDREPGLSVSEVARRCEMYWTSAKLHVDRLRRDGLVDSVRMGRQRVLFPRVLLDQLARCAPALLGEPSCRRVALTILQSPGLRVWELCDKTGMSERSVYHHVQRLVEAGLVRSDEERAYRGLEPTPELHAIFRPHGDV